MRGVPEKRVEIWALRKLRLEQEEAGGVSSSPRTGRASHPEWIFQDAGTGGREHWDGWGPSAPAAPCHRLQAGQSRRRYADPGGLPWASADRQHGPVYENGRAPVRWLLAGLTGPGERIGCWL